MRREYQKLSSNIKPVEPSTGLFDRIIAAIKKEQEFRHSKRLFFLFFTLLIVSVGTAPFPFAVLSEQIENSGIFYFLSTATSNFGFFLAVWQDFILAILESLPIIGIAAFALNIALALFTLRLFLYKKRYLFKYLTHNFNASF